MLYMKFFESSRRSLVKSLTFRVIVIISDLVVVYAVTRRFDLAVTFMVTTNIASMILYYLHERFWNGVRWGRSRQTRFHKEGNGHVNVAEAYLSLVVNIYWIKVFFGD